MGAEGAKAIAECLEVNASVQLLGLVRFVSSFCFVSTSFSLHLLRLRYPKRIICAAQDGNQIGDDGVKAIAKCLKVNTSVLELGLVRFFYYLAYI